MTRPYKGKKWGTGRHVQILESMQTTAAWRDLKPGPRALYIELKRRFNGSNNGRITLSHREAALACNCHRNTVGEWFRELEAHGFIEKKQEPYLGPDGVGRTALWELQELACDGKPAKNGFRKWKPPEAPHKKCAKAA